MSDCDFTDCKENLAKTTSTKRAAQSTVSLSNEQFTQLLSTIGHKGGTFTTCSASYDGTKDPEVVESFLAAASVFKRIERISDEDALISLPLLLKDNAGIWWQGVKNHITGWEQFCQRLQHAFCPKRPAYVIYQEIFDGKQAEGTPTESYIAHKRMLFAQLPTPEHTESQQIDMVFGQLHISIREKIPRTTVTTFDDLLKAAREVEMLMANASTTRPSTQKNEKCGICHFVGHISDDCRRIKKNHIEPDKPVGTRTGEAFEATTPKFSCYGCGKAGVVRSNCPNCSAKKVSCQVSGGDLGFCAMNTHVDARPRPVVFVDIAGVKGAAYIDSCAKTSIASYSLYQHLKEMGAYCSEVMADITLADGVRKRQKVIKIGAVVCLEHRKIPTTFIVLPQSNDDRTLLGIGFIQDAQMVLNLPQYTYQFLGSGETYELYQENFVSFPTKTYSNRATQARTMDKEKTGMKHPIETAYCPTGIIPEEKTINLKKHRVAFDGYSPKMGFLDNIMDDAVEAVKWYEPKLTPKSFNVNDVIYNELPYIHNTDASEFAIDAVGVQGEGGDEHLIENASNLLNKTTCTSDSYKFKTLASVILNTSQVHLKDKTKETVNVHRQVCPTYKLGDLVLVATHPISKAAQGITSKFAPRRDGLYVITRQHGPGSFEVSPPNNSPQPIGVYHSSDLTPYVGSVERPTPLPVKPLRKKGRPRKVD